MLLDDFLDNSGGFLERGLSRSLEFEEEGIELRVGTFRTTKEVCRTHEFRVTKFDTF